MNVDLCLQKVENRGLWKYNLHTLEALQIEFWNVTLEITKGSFPECITEFVMPM
jgi:hypothetical protein